MFAPFDSYDDATVVFTFGGYSVGVWVSFIVAVLLFIAFFVRMIQHENQAYKAIILEEPIERGPIAEGEPAPY
jgi:heme exporter protein D